MIGQHFPEQRLAMPEQRFGRKILADRSALPKDRHIDAQGHIARAGKDRTQRPHKIFAPIEQFPRANLITAAMRMPIENRRQLSVHLRRTRHDPAHDLPANAQAQMLKDKAIRLFDRPIHQGDRPLLKAQKLAKPRRRYRHYAPTFAGLWPTQLLNRASASPKAISSSPPPRIDSGWAPSARNHCVKKWIAPNTATLFTTQRRLANTAQAPNASSASAQTTENTTPSSPTPSSPKIEPMKKATFTSTMATRMPTMASPSCSGLSRRETR